MALRKGLNAVRESKEAADSRGGSGGQIWKLILKENTTVTGRFFGNFDDEESDDYVPVVHDGHYIKRLGNQKAFQMCNGNCDQPCAFCFMKDERGDRGIGRSESAAVVFKPSDKYHKFDNPIRVLKAGAPKPVPGKKTDPKHYEETKYVPCAGGKKPCPYCAQGNKAQEQGFKYISLSTSHFGQLLEKKEQLAAFCLCGAVDDGEGTLTEHYTCAQCEEPVEYNSAKGRSVCRSCGHKGVPSVVLSCSSCDDPRSATIGDFRWRITCISANKKRSYDFSPIMPLKPPSAEDLEAYSKVKPNWEELLAGLPAQQQFKLLGIPVPEEFGGDGDNGAESYDDDEDNFITGHTEADDTDEDEDSDDDGFVELADDDDEDYATPPTRTPPKKTGQLAKVQLPAKTLPKPAAKPPVRGTQPVRGRPMAGRSR